MKYLLLIPVFCLYTLLVQAQIKPFRFVHISDTHIGSPNGGAEEDLQRTIDDINAMTDVAFVIITGDITELGTNDQLKRAKELFDKLRIKYYIIPGNHDSGWSESGGVSFITTFGYDKFQFDFNGIRFIGCASGPYVRMSDGHIPRDATMWLADVLKKTPKEQPVIFCNHYPLDNGLDNWYEAIDLLKKNNTILAICGHGHNNKAMNFEDIPGVMGRSNLRAKAAVGGYNLVDVRMDSILYTERRPGVETLPVWAGVAVKQHNYAVPSKKFDRPDYAINKQYKQVTQRWTVNCDANVISTPVLSYDKVIFGTQSGEVMAVSMKPAKKIWSFKTNGAIFSSPAASKNKVVLGSGDGHIYCLDANKGTLLWKVSTDASVLGSPLIAGDTVYIGGSDHRFRALDLTTGKQYWQFDSLQGPVVSTPLLYEGKIIFGAWDKYLYALNKHIGALEWKWTNGSSVINFSPASCIPVASNGAVYIVTPDRTITAIDAQKGTTLWRNNQTRLRESIGISEDGKWVYGKTMQDTVVAYAASREAQQPAWVFNAGFGYEHVPSMLIEKEGRVYFGTRNGVVYCMDPAARKVIWAHKIDNSMVNTVRVLNRSFLIASTMDGKVTLLGEKSPDGKDWKPVKE